LTVTCTSTGRNGDEAPPPAAQPAVSQPATEEAEPETPAEEESDDDETQEDDASSADSSESSEQPAAETPAPAASNAETPAAPAEPSPAAASGNAAPAEPSPAATSGNAAPAEPSPAAADGNAAPAEPSPAATDGNAGEAKQSGATAGRNAGAPVAQVKAPEDRRQSTDLPRIAILPFTGVSGADGENIALILSNDREIQTAFTVVPRTASVNSKVTAQSFQQSGITDTDTISAIGKELYADFVITGHIKKLGERNLVILSIVEVLSFRQISGSYREFAELGELRVLLPDITKRMLEAMWIDTTNMPALAVLPFTVPAGVSAQDAEVLAQLLAIEIANTGRYIVLPRTSTIEATLANLDSRYADLTGINSVKAIGRAIDAHYALAGNVIRLGENLNLFLAQILSIDSAALLVGSDVEYRTITDGLHLMPELSFQLTGIRSELSDYSVPANMLWIGGGSFRMGNSEGEVDEQPVHPTQVSGFFMGKAEVTQKEYEAIIGNNPSSTKGDNLPVTNISWFDAVEYCNKLSRKSGLTPAYSGSNDNISCNFTANGYRLPTEAEWEYAARGGNRDTLSFAYAGGNTADILGWHSGNSASRVHEIAAKQANSLGLYDMSGNVWEWCWDWYGAYTARAATDPKGASRGESRVTRGGSWNSDASQLRSTYRSAAPPAGSYHDAGFRVIRPIF
jgi:formylglycine-generating enzyme required for sulfatase activity